MVVGLGPGDAGLLTVATRAAIDDIAVRFVRTTRHPSAAAVGLAVSFDGVYDTAATLEDVYETVAGRVADAAVTHGVVVYAVPGSPLVAERTVELLRADERIQVEVMPALSFLDLAWARLGIDPVAAGARLVDGHRFALEAAGSTGPLLVAQCDSATVMSDIKLSVDIDPGEVTVLQRLGLPDETVTRVAWADLDRAVTADHLTCVWIPRLAEPVAAGTVRLVELVRTLRGCCPWDARQTHRSLGRHLLEESYEVLDAIDELPPAPIDELPVAADREDDREDDRDRRVVAVDAEPRPESDDLAWEHLEEELGDLLFQVVFHSVLGTEAGRFGFGDVARGVHDKLVDRHPHVFGGVQAPSAEAVALGWEQRKKIEKGRTSVMDGIPSTLPALLYADKVQRKATAVGLDWPDAQPLWAVVAGELDELRAAVGVGAAAGVAAELGDVLFSVVNLGRKLGVDAEAALRSAAVRFRRRVETVEALAAAADVDPVGAPAAIVDDWWEQAKRLTDG